MRSVATVGVRRAGRPSLMVTFRTPKTWPRHTTRWLRESVRPRFVISSRADAENHQSQSASAGLVLGMLVGLTTLAVAWVSIWWVPAYLTLMFIIFVIPDARGRPERRTALDEKSTIAVRIDSGQGLQSDRVCEGAHNHLTVGSLCSPMTGETAMETATSDLDLSSSGVTRSRRRSRARKAAKPAVEHGLESAAVTWVRVGPGKFVRASAGTQVIDEAASDEVTPGNLGVTGPSLQKPPASSASADTLVTEQGSPDLPESTPGEEWRTVGSDDSTQGSVAEVYGIAPSTFSLISSDSSLAAGFEQSMPELASSLQAECDPKPHTDGNLPPESEDRHKPNPERSTSSSRLQRFSLGIVNAIRGGDRTFLRRNVGKGPNNRLPNRSFSGASHRHLQAERRAFGRSSHIQRVQRPRSPPFP